MTKRYSVYGIMTASVHLGDYEAESEAMADVLAENDNEADWTPCLCYHCASKIELGEIYDTQIVKQGG